MEYVKIVLIVSVLVLSLTFLLVNMSYRECVTELPAKEITSPGGEQILNFSMKCSGGIPFFSQHPKLNATKLIEEGNYKD